METVKVDRKSVYCQQPKYDQNDKSQKALLKLKSTLYVALQSARNR